MLFALVTITALLAPAGATETEPPFVGGPTISGTPSVGEMLTAKAGSWTDLRGQIYFQWRACRGTQPDRTCAVRVAVGHQHACAKLEGSAFQCWGYPQDAQIPQDIGGVADVSAGFSSTCARSETGRVRCWEDYGRDRVDYPVPTDLPPIGQLSSRRRDACGVVAGTGEVRCWGPNLHGQSTVPDYLPPVSQVATSL
ncbi:RCC1 domain-containing protein [Nocardioides sp. AX2bis]|uniref:RCC1 domain-containing protein n=1 Tax=Nocardioides sp. AX2bis TaxID=2653157 RepID=UPI0012F3B12B|nr:RCC1 domain-containing protein [Nocardioides sp. AX2bis]VXB68202.1 exported hypothetical protein [Nocardioides sp. AX2bis]